MKEDAPQQAHVTPSAQGVPVAAGCQAGNSHSPHVLPLQPTKGIRSTAERAAAAGPPTASREHDAASSVRSPNAAAQDAMPSTSHLVAASRAAEAARNGSSEQTGEPSKSSTVVCGAGATSADAARRSPLVEKSGDTGANRAGAAEYLYLQVAAQQQLKCTLIDRTDSRPPGEFIRRHGFTRPFQIYQVVSWVLFGLEIVMFYLVVIPAVSVPLKSVFGALFGLTAVTLFVLAYRCTSTDPIDPIAFLSGPWVAPVEGEAQEERRERIETEPAEATRSCNVCGGVQERSKHCRSCNKCVDVFDHHCIWINNCVGKANYRVFVCMLISAGVLVVMLMALCLYQIIAEAVIGASAPHWRQTYQWFNPAAFYVISTIPIAVNVPIFGLVVQLLLLHFYLIYHHMTTFDYITMRVEEEVENKRPGVRYRACTEWIVIDKKRLRRAKRRASNTGHVSDVSQCAPVSGPSPTVELQASKAVPEKDVYPNQVAAEGKPRRATPEEADALIAKV